MSGIPFKDDFFPREFREKAQVAFSSGQQIGLRDISVGLGCQANGTIVSYADDDQRFHGHGGFPSMAKSMSALTVAAARALPPLRPRRVITGTGRRNAASLLSDTAT